MTLLTKTVESECFLLPQRMPRRVLQVTAQEPPSSSLALKASTSRYDPGMFFFLGGTVLLIILLILLFIFWRRTKGPAKVNSTLTCQQHGKYIKPYEAMKMMVPNIQPGQMEFISGNLRTISYFDFRTLRRATKNFHPRNLLGSGGFGPVYQGKLADGRLVAVKTLSLDKSQQGEKEFLAEVRMITSIQHKNLVRLLGCCTDGPQKILVGYTAPEYAIRGELSEKADIYSFGVLVLEIICCRKNTDLTLPSEMQYLPEYAWKLYEKSMLMEIVDPRLREEGMEEKDVMQAFHVALSCLQPHADLRPAMSEIVALLTFKVEMVAKPVRPTFVHRRRVMDDENHSWGAISSSSEPSTTAVASL
ncbi:hypothetical protein V8G54_015965 [Vigna mungo]|uniref:Protein kinase domain-containing protein n=1 Tax=Vigna mungo TaxID=3915 RepID=A0AAQ3NKB3_VIGMU